MHATILLRTAIDDGLAELTENPSVVVDYLRSLGERIIAPAISIGLIVIISLILLRLLRMVVYTTITRLLERSDSPPREVQLKATTLAHVVVSAGRMMIILIAGMMILSSLGLDIAPLIASAGIAGLAIGLGAQSLIKDLIAGFFILIEDQYAVGDVIRVGDAAGLVEFLSLRRTMLRSIDGSVIVIPNGEIRTVTNMTKGWSRAVLDIGVSYEADVDRALELLRELLDGIEEDPVIGDAIVAPADVTGVESLGPYQVTIRALIKTRPMEQWRVQRELRRRIKQAFEAEGITIHYPLAMAVLQDAPDGTAPATPLSQARKGGERGTSGR